MTTKAASKQWRAVTDQLRPKVPKLATLMDGPKADVLAFMIFPKDHRSKIHSINPLKRLNGEIKRRTDIMYVPQRGCGHTAACCTASRRFHFKKVSSEILSNQADAPPRRHA